jgi:hypothetical protein
MNSSIKTALLHTLAAIEFIEILHNNEDMNHNTYAKLSDYLDLIYHHLILIELNRNLPNAI